MENIALFGRTGNGISSTGNSIVGKHVFVTKSDEAGVTMECESEIVETPAGRPKLRVIDTPSLFDLTSSADYISKQIVRCLHLAEGGLDAVLLVLSVGNRLTKEDEVVLSTLMDIFGSKIVDYVIVVFTAGDVLEEDHETIESYLDGCPDFLKRLLESCEQRMVVFDNKTENEKKTKQFQELLNAIDLVRKHTNYKPYTENMYHMIIQKEIDKKKKEHEELEKKEMTEEESEKESEEEFDDEFEEENDQVLEGIIEMMKKDNIMTEERRQRVGKQGFGPDATQNVMGKGPGLIAPMGMTVRPSGIKPCPDIEYGGSGPSFSRRGMTSGFEPKLTESVLGQMRSKTEAQKAREDKHHAEEEKHLEEMQNEIDRMQRA